MFLRYTWALLFMTGLYVLYSYDYHKFIILKFLTANDDGKIEPLFTKDELRKYTNLENGLYISILGQVYDVTKGAKHYEHGATYHAFTGRDASLAFVTGKFTDEELTDDLSSLSAQQIKSLDGWAQFYAKNYIYKGKLIGRYYSKDGSPTAEFYKLQKKLTLAEEESSDKERKKKMFPPCNVEWKSKIGTRVWCTNKSGGIHRDWTGVPQMFYEQPGLNKYRCACVRMDSNEYMENRGNLKEYSECSRDSTSCIINVTNT